MIRYSLADRFPDTHQLKLNVSNVMYKTVDTAAAG